jgi:hypothetical protein
MKFLNLLTFIWVLGTVPALAASPMETAEQIKNQAVFCNGTYSYCVIKFCAVRGS